ncbi:MAG: TadE family protein [Sneathiella sp.]
MIFFRKVKIQKSWLSPLDETGNVAVELVLVAPILLALIFTLVDMGRIIITDSILQSVVGELSSEYRVLSEESRSVISKESVSQNLSKIVGTSGRGWIDLEKLSFEVNSDGGESYIGNSGQLVTYELTYGMTSTTPFVHYVMDKTFFLRQIRLSVRNRIAREL